MQTSSSAGQAGKMRSLSAWVRSTRGRLILQFTLITLVLAFFIYELIVSWRDLSNLHLKLNYAYLALSLLPLIGRPFLSAFGWWQIVRKLRGNLGIGRSIYIYFISGLARYLPGPFLGSIGRAVMAEENGVAAEVAGISVLIELALLVASGAFLGLIWVLFTVGLANITLYLVALGAGSLLLLEPRIFLAGLNWLMVKLHRKPMAVSLRLGDMLQLIAPYFLNWLLNGFTFYLVVNAIFPAPAQMLNLAGIYIAALTIAIFGLTFPDGWGIREATLGTMLVAFAGIPAAIAAGLTIFTRVWWMVAEALWVGLAFSLRGRAPADVPNPPTKI